MSLFCRRLYFLAVLWLGTACTATLPPVETNACKVVLHGTFPPAARSEGSGIKAAFVSLPNEDQRASRAEGSKQEALYDFKLPTDDSAGIEIQGLSDAQLFLRYGEAVRRDLQAAAAAAGILMSGPYKRRSELAYPQKDGLDFIFIPGDLPERFEFVIEEAREASSGDLSPDVLLSYVLSPRPKSGSAAPRLKPLHISGRVRIPPGAALWVVEPLSGEKLAVEPLAPNAEFLPLAPRYAVLGYQLDDRIVLPQSSLDSLTDDPEVARLRCELLNRQYQATVSGLTQALAPGKLKPLLPLSRALKGRVVYPSQGVSVGN